jgi:3D (Asp-Asp-Asp) domain-containing protein
MHNVLLQYVYITTTTAQQYAATTGVFWTGTDDSGSNSDSPWATTPHVIVAGGIVHVNSSDTSGLYKATDTIDILREVSS